LNDSGWSSKRWVITRKGKRIKLAWGATIILKRKPKFKYTASKLLTFRSERLAKQEYKRRVRAKLKKGYKRQ
jgi:hypothetical protein